jgi:hypothetical protein
MGVGRLFFLLAQQQPGASLFFWVFFAPISLSPLAEMVF